MAHTRRSGINLQEVLFSRHQGLGTELKSLGLLGKHGYPLSQLAGPNCPTDLLRVPLLSGSSSQSKDIVTLSTSNPGTTQIVDLLLVIILGNSGRLGRPSKSWLNRTFFRLHQLLKDNCFFLELKHFRALQVLLPRTLWPDDTLCGSALCQCHRFLAFRQKTPSSPLPA